MLVTMIHITLTHVPTVHTHTYAATLTYGRQTNTHTHTLHVDKHIQTEKLVHTTDRQTAHKHIHDSSPAMLDSRQHVV